MRVVKAGTTDVSVVIRIIDSTDGTPETGVVWNTAGIDIEYRREGAVSVDIVEATLAALTTAHTDGGFLHIGNGYYRLDLPDAACAAGATGVLIHGTVTGMVVIGEYIQLVTYDPFDAVRLGLTALPNAAADGAGGLPISDAGGLDLDTKLANTNEVTAARMGALTDWIDGGRLDLILDAILNDTDVIDDATSGLVKIATDVAVILGDVGTDIPATLTEIIGYVSPGIADLVTAVADIPSNAELTAAFTEIKGATWAATDTLEAIRDRGDAAWTTATGFATAAALTTHDGKLDTLTTNVAAVKAETALIVEDTGTTLPGTLTTIAGYLDTEIAAILEDTGTTLPALIASEISDALTVDALVDGKTITAALQIIAAVTAGKITTAGAADEIFLGLDGLTTRVTATVDVSGNRNPVVYG